MKKSDFDLLRERWTEQNLNEGMRFLFGKGDAPFPKLDRGYEDLRGMPIREVLKRVTIADVDLSDAYVERFGQIGSYSTVKRCVFRRALLDTNVQNWISECDFTSAKMGGATLRGEFVDCDFTSANLTSVGGTEVKFVRCAFVKTNFRKAHLIHCSFEDCRFEDCKFGTGSLGGSRFVRSPIDPVTLGNTIMDHVKWS